MPTIFVWNHYRFYFFSNEGLEPPHVHIDKGSGTAKFWLSPVKLASSARFRDNELIMLEKQVRKERDMLLKAWYDYFENHR